jgi:hypothetical protein
MDKELQKKLMSSFPTIYGNLDGPILSWGFECGNGWFELLFELSSRIESELRKVPDAKIIVQQVKEKFGTLRYYYSLVNLGYDVIEPIVTEYENKSENTCAVCGKFGKLRDGSWLVTLCDEHVKK